MLHSLLASSFDAPSPSRGRLDRLLKEEVDSLQIMLHSGFPSTNRVVRIQVAENLECLTVRAAQGRTQLVDGKL